MKKFVALFDRHYGWEKRRINGRLQTKSTHDQRLFNNALEFVKDFQPDIVVDGGDGFNMSSVSRHNRGKPRLTEGFSLKKEYDYAYRYQIQPLEEATPRAQHIMLKGNHEYWIELLMDEHPELEDLIDPYTYLNLPENWEIVEYGDVKKLSSKLYVCHGDNMRFTGIHRAAALLRSYQRNIICGHFHTAQTFTDKSLANEHSHIAICAPMLGDPQAEYIRRAPSSGIQGFVYGYIQPNGNFNAYTVIATGGRFTVEGKLYG